ncbi:MAG TPA: roadblock/LC7 domain-containing protein [Trueperaceae bacterium]
MTELDEILAHLVEQVDGSVAAAVAGMDGLLVEQYSNDETDLSAAAAEITNILASARSAMSTHLRSGDLRELVLGSQERVGYVRLLGNDLFCLMLLEAEGNLGKARLYTDQAGARLAQVLA